MSLSVVCHECGKILYGGIDMISLFRLKRRTDGKCPDCGRKFSDHPLSMTFGKKVNN